MNLPIAPATPCESLLTANRSLIVSGSPVLDTVKDGDFLYFEVLSHGAGGVIPDARVVMFKSLHRDKGRPMHILAYNGTKYFQMDINKDSWINLSAIVGQVLYVTVADEYHLRTPPEQKIGNFLIYKMKITGMNRTGLIVQDVVNERRIPWQYVYLPALTGRMFIWPPPDQGYPVRGVL